jgi:hypothetical protein
MSSRFSMATLYDPFTASLIFFGGTTGVLDTGSETNEMWQYDLKTGQFSVAVQLGNPITPGPRTGTVGGTLMQLDAQTYYLYGGADSRAVYGEVWQYSVATKIWRKIATDRANAPEPEPRFNHFGFVRNASGTSTMCVLAGKSSTYVLNDMWCWAPAAGWSFILPANGTQALVPPMSNFDAVYDFVSDVIYTITGTVGLNTDNSNGSPRGQLMKFTWSTRVWSIIPLPAFPYTFGGTLWLHGSLLTQFGGLDFYLADMTRLRVLNLDNLSAGWTIPANYVGNWQGTPQTEPSA